MVQVKEGLLVGASYFPSPHCNARPDNCVIDMIVVHGISLPPGKFGGEFIHQLFCGELDTSGHPYFTTLEGLKVSSHLLIDRVGRVSQFVPFHRRAWHAGESFFAGRTVCNDFSIGIELEGTDDLPYEEEQYQVLSHLCYGLMQVYPAITPDRIVGHCHIAPQRKTDPGAAFDWCRFREMIQSFAD